MADELNSKTYTESTLPPSQINWFHSIDLGNGVVTPGIRPLDEVRDFSDIIFSHPITGKTVLDIGAWDGYFSFEAEKRGASRVLATDHYCWSGSGWGSKAGFNFAHKALNSRVESLDIDIVDLDPARLGTFDFVMMLGVLYHLKDPLGGLEKCAAMTSDCLVVETHSDMNDISEPVMRYYLGTELNDDKTNFWGPNVHCLENMLRELGFRMFEHRFYPAPAKLCRLFMHAWH